MEGTCVTLVYDTTNQPIEIVKLIILRAIISRTKHNFKGG
jgi:hypothetical protein